MKLETGNHLPRFDVECDDLARFLVCVVKNYDRAE